MTLVEFLTARLDEDEQVARDAPEGPWETTTSSTSRAGFEDAELYAAHIRRHDPARVLREVEAARRRIELHSVPHECHSYNPMHREMDNCYWVMEGEYCTTLRLETLPYADHPDYREEWRP